jgi:hypothetical protein
MPTFEEIVLMCAYCWRELLGALIAVAIVFSLQYVLGI